MASYRSLASPSPATHERLELLELEQRDSWSALPLETVARRLSTSLGGGLTPSESAKRLDVYGRNALERTRRTPVLVAFLLQFHNLIIAMLLAAAVLALCFQEFVDGVTILLIVVLNSAVATYQEHSAGSALEALAHMASPQSVVVRGGGPHVVDSDELVPGDVVVLATGDIVPADLRLIESNNLKVNEMLVTGESEDVAKRAGVKQPAGTGALTAANMVFSSTTVTAGNARGVVVATGMATRVGSIAALLKSSSDSSTKEDHEAASKCRNPLAECVEKHQPKQTPLQESLNRLGLLMGTIGVAVCVVVYIVGYFRGNEDPKHPDRAVWLNMIMVAVSLAVTAVPEGMPVVVTLSLSSGTLSMVKKNVLVRRLAAVETLGAASVICTDKTGTLTEGKMTAVKLWADSKEYDITGKGLTPTGEVLLGDVSHSDSPVVQSTLLVAVLCSNTKLKQGESESDGAEWQTVGDSTEAPLVVAAAKIGIWADSATARYKRVLELPFSSARKMMVTVVQLPADSKQIGSIALEKNTVGVACVKGAPNYVLDCCTRYCLEDGTVAELAEDHRAQILEAMDDLASRALRVLAIAIRPLSDLPPTSDAERQFSALSQDLTFIGLVASIDPERDGVMEAIEMARHASIRTVMITGDYVKTAVAIADNIGLIGPSSDLSFEATDCEVLRPGGHNYLPDDVIDTITSRTLVFARAKPEDKIVIVKSLQRQGMIAAMTGDGVNDAPALQAADIGVAMGVSGTEVAKGASDMILTDDNFVSIVAAVEQGRAIYANIQKFVMFFLSANFGLIPMMFAAIAAGMPLPMEALQILMLNLFSNGMPAMALSLDESDGKLMESAPRPKTQPLIHGRVMWMLVTFNAALVAVGSMCAFVLGLYWNFGLFLQADILVGDLPTSIATCRRWDGMESGWRMHGNCAARFDDGAYVFGAAAAASGRFEAEGMVCQGGDYDCVAEGIAMAQTLTFATLTLLEVVMAYTLRQRAASALPRAFSNKYLNLAAVLAIALAVTITNVPVVMDDLFDFAHIPWWHWLAAAAIAATSGVLNEVYKLVLRASTVT